MTPRNATRSTRSILARSTLVALLLMGLAACNGSGSDDPSQDATTAAAGDSGATAGTAAGDGSMATEGGMATDGSMATDASGTSGAMGTDGTMGADGGQASANGTTGAMGNGGQTDATLDADLQACSSRAASEQAGCRADAQGRYTQRAASGDGTTPTTTP